MQRRKHGSSSKQDFETFKSDLSYLNIVKNRHWLLKYSNFLNAPSKINNAIPSQGTDYDVLLLQIGSESYYPIFVFGPWLLLPDPREILPSFQSRNTLVSRTIMR